MLKAQEEAERARLDKMAEEMKQADMKEEEIKQRMAQQQAEFERKLREN